MSFPARRWLWTAALLVMIVVGAAFRLLDGITLDVFDGLVGALLPAAAGGACLFVARQREDRRRAWRLLGLSCLSWAAGGAVWTWLSTVRGVFPFPSLADVGYLGSYPLAVAAMLSFPAVPADRAGRVRMLLDGVIIATSLLFCSWALVLRPVYEAGGGTPLEQAFTLTYPYGDLVVVVVVLLTLTWSPRDDRTPLALIGAGLGAIAVADSGFAILVINGTYSADNLISLGWVAGYLLITIAALEAVRGRPTAPATTDGEALWHVVLPYVPVCGVVAVAVAQRVAGRDLDVVLNWAAIALLVALGTRQLAVLLANRKLITQLRAKQAQLVHQALHDPLTGLANRVLFDDRVDHALQRRGGGTVAVLFYDIDDFKIVNDSLGHHAGDAVLRAVATRLSANARPSDTVARLGGDEFALLLEEPGAATDATVVARRLLDLSTSTYQVDGHDVIVTGSIGIAFSANDDADRLLRNADVAMYTAKARGKSRYAVFEPEMRGHANRRVQLGHRPRTTVRDAPATTSPPGAP